MTHSIDTMIQTSFVYGAASAVICTTGYLYLLELAPKKNEKRVGTIFWLFDQIPYLMAIMYFWFVSLHWSYLLMVGYCMQILGFLLCLILPESPAYLLSLNRVDETIQVFS